MFSLPKSTSNIKNNRQGAVISISQISLFLDFHFGILKENASTEPIYCVHTRPYVHLINYEGCLVAVPLKSSISPIESVEMVFFHHFHHLPFRAESITAERKSNYTNYEAFRNDDTLGNVLNVSISKEHVGLATLPSRFPKFYIKTVSDDKNYSCDLKMRVEIRGSMLFLRDEKHIFLLIS